jgi:hypothetical protein
MDAEIVVALIVVAGSAIVAVLNHLLAGRVKVQEKELKVQEKELAWIKTLIGLVTSDSQRAHLQKFAEGAPFMEDINRGSGFEWELRHLLSIKLIDRVRPEKGMRTLFALSGSQNVKEHLCITQRGRDYLRISAEALS